MFSSAKITQNPIIKTLIFPEDADHRFLPAEYNFILFFSLPFYPVCRAYRKTVSFNGHLSLTLGKNVYQLHDPEKLRSSFLVSKMPTTSWLFEDGRWYEWDPSSDQYRHVHLYERAEVKRTVVFYAALKNMPPGKLSLYEEYFNTLEEDFQRGTYRFSLLGNNCSRAINRVFYREDWLKPGPLDFLPAITFKRLITSWKKRGFDFIAGYLDVNRLSQFRLHKLCFGLFTPFPERELANWLKRKGTTCLPSCFPKPHESTQ
jgi:hypothetical protein